MATDYHTCKACRHIDPDSRSGYKWHCTWYGRYEDPDELHTCPRFESRDSTSCFLTSACCQHRGLPDDCAELTALRAFRDTHLKATEEGRQLVEEYYRIAPALVDKLNAHPARDALYEDIYTAVCSIVAMLEREEFEEAVSSYREMVLGVQAAVTDM